MKKFFEEFKEFAVRGNAVSMAIGIVIGAAFTAIVNSIIDNLIQPILGLIMGNIDLDTALAFRIGNGAYFNFGAVLMAIISFIITALVLFLIVKFLNALQKKKEEEEAAAPEPSNEEKLLTEIRDLLSQK